MSTAIVIWCLVFGDDPESIFPVDIEATKTVVELKDAIKEKKKPDFDDIDAAKLDLFRVSIPFEDRWFEKLNNLDLLHDEALLENWMTLSSIFSDQSAMNVAKNQLHVIRVLRLNCCLQNPDLFNPGRIFSVQITYGQTVEDLKEAIKAKMPNILQYVEAYTLELWKVSLPVDDDCQENFNMPARNLLYL
ncbi:hypothetical protein M378DRAFT_333200 [Amanita muscaria Koide BX008]|uniref:Crinkler effector protein N-terminal domain-containing protein n=1 Tax=Amanita muscaria (strain Koide BX008) TaxID=946122 RepID=A0A0C2WAN5_AMAMK|nr:hypothetical protein M378DRAFT_333200 [Amanita muscaria Koide BX008]